MVQARFGLDDSADIPRLATRSSRMVRPPIPDMFKRCDMLNLGQATSGELRPSNEFELFTARSNCIMGGSCRVIGGSVRIQDSRFVNPIDGNRELGDPP